MKNNYLLLIGALSLVAVGCSDKPKGDLPTSSYYLGFQMGSNLKKQNLTVDTKEIVHGLRDGLAGKDAALNPAEMSTAQQTFSRLAADAHHQMQENNEATSKKFLAENKKADGWKETASGLQYKVITEGKGPLPTDKDVITVHYVGTLIDGTKFDSSRDRTAPAEYRLNGVIKGMKEALGMMREGSHYAVALPPELGYGPSGNGPIPPSAVLLYDLEVLKIGPAGEAGNAGKPAAAPAHSKKK